MVRTLRLHVIANGAEKSEREVYEQSSTGRLFKFCSTFLFHDFAKVKIFVHNISFETNRHIRKTFHHPNVV